MLDLSLTLTPTKHTSTSQHVVTPVQVVKHYSPVDIVNISSDSPLLSPLIKHNPVIAVMKLTGMQGTLIVLACMLRSMNDPYCHPLYTPNVLPIVIHCNIRGLRDWKMTGEPDPFLVLHCIS